MHRAENVEGVHSRIENRFADTLRFLLKEHGKKQKDLAGYLGIRPQAVSLYCTGNTYPDIHTLIRIAEFFDVNIHYLVTGQKEEHKYIRSDLGLPSKVIDMLLKVKEGEFNLGANIQNLLYNILGNRDFYTMLMIASFTLKKSYCSISEIESCKDEIASVLHDKNTSVNFIKASVTDRCIHEIKTAVSNFFSRFLIETACYEDLISDDNADNDSLNSETVTLFNDLYYPVAQLLEQLDEKHTLKNAQKSY